MLREVKSKDGRLMDLLEPEQEAAKGSKSNSYNRYDSGSQNGSTVAIIQTTITGMTIHTTTVDALFITAVLSMVMATRDILRVALISQQGTTMGFVINYVYLMCGGLVGNMICYVTLYYQ